MNYEDKQHKLLLSIYHMNQVLHEYSDLLPKYSIRVDTIIRTSVVREADLFPISNQYDVSICIDDVYTNKVSIETGSSLKSGNRHRFH